MCNKSQNQKKQPTAAPYENVQWSALNDRQKAQLLLGSTRLPDAEIFLEEFDSFENPVNSNFKSAGNTLNNAS